MSLLYVKAREMLELDAKVQQAQNTNVRQIRKPKPAPNLKNR
ncbi:hypothetical protein [Bacillus haikouensis]|jgi:hypothetical protein|nr:hypothetical protein [Bacillus haikouensis]